MSEMIERVARAIWKKADEQYLGTEKMEDCDAIARAAIEAMREPTMEMIAAGAHGSGEDSDRVAIGAWKEMIDAALSAEAMKDR